MSEHDVLTFARGLSGRLATRSRHVSVFLGAGTSKACGLPDVGTLQESISAKLNGESKAHFDRLVTNRGLEQALSRLRRIAAIVEGSDQVDGLDAQSAQDLDRSICEAIVSEISGSDSNLNPVELFAAWIARADYTRPVEIFTVNYDLLIEQALDSVGVPYFDGFVGSMRARFRSDLVEASPSSDDYIPRFFARLWKLHGSLNWERSESDVVRLGQPVPSGTPAAIYPSDAKYEESRRVPFVVLQDRLRRALCEPESLTLVSGYSWSDEHLNELFFDATTRRPRSEVIAFCFDSIPDELAIHATKTPNLQVVTQSEAILGGIRAPWSCPPDTTDLPADIWKDGSVSLGDFRSLAQFLSRATTTPSVIDDPIGMTRIDSRDGNG
ncbi:SIR2 family protein [Rhodococcus pyridinivorans]|uniref:SIR2 family protein n=1 Tax=Rhodococcus pyridinivorans TaxID=103816 RepID=UPI0019073F2D|nr:SIR2 family protein [Rhodococcus pyridinivorans]QQM53419.1 SIR2 family protein [Rhodococcus pyridinivorans]